MSEVMRAAEEPRPVLWTSEIGTPVGRNLGRDCRDLSVGGRLRALSYIEYERKKTSKMGNNASELELGETKQTTRVARLGAYLSPLRIEIIVTDNGNCEIIRQTFLKCF